MQRIIGVGVTAGMVVAVLIGAWFGLADHFDGAAASPNIIAQAPPIADSAQQLGALRDAVLSGDHAVIVNAADLGQASSYQQTLLSDGNLSLAEYHQAATDWAICAQAGGLPVPIPVRLNGLGTNARALLIGANVSAESAEKTAQACTAEYLDVIARAWTDVTAPLEAEVVRVSRAAVAACFKSTGYPVDRDPAVSEDLPIAEAYSRCAAQVAAEFDIPVTFGMDGF